jgi:polysaccharide biosynthesis/export protein
MIVQQIRIRRWCGTKMCAGMIVAASCALSSAQPAAKHQLDVAPADPAFAIAASASLSKFESTGTEEYTIGDGDEIDVQVMARPELSGNHVVGPDGKITLPISGSYEIRNQTREDAAHQIAAALERYYTSVEVTVRVTKYGSNRILVLGHVAQPGILYFDQAPTLLEALSKSHAIAANAPGHEASFPRRCAIFRGKDQVVWIDLKTMMDGGGASADLRLRRDDVLYVPDEQDDMVTVLGEVAHPGMARLDSNTTLLNVLATSGGVNIAAGKAKIEIVRPSTGVTREIAFNDLLNNPAKAAEVSLQRGDVVYVQKGTAAKFEYILQQIAPAAGMLMFGAAMK